MEDDLTLQFQSFQGLHQVVKSGNRMRALLSDLIKRIRSKGNSCAGNQHKEIKLLDTFLSDSLGDEELTDMLKLCSDCDHEMKILVLDPFSEIAAARAKSLGSKLGTIGEINTALFNIRVALCEAQRKPGPSRDSAENFMRESFIEEQLEYIRSERRKISLDVRFYSRLTESPTYIVGHVAAKGIIKEGKSAAFNPWMIIVDDTSQPDDLYDHLSQNFDSIWELGDKTPQKRRCYVMPNERSVFISHGRKDNIHEKMDLFLRDKLRLNPRLFESEAHTTTIIENLKRLTRECSGAIVVLTKEDSQASGNVRPRQNVIHELGFCQALYGEERVILLAEKGVELPSNIAGIVRVDFDKDNFIGCYESLRDRLAKIWD